MDEFVREPATKAGRDRSVAENSIAIVPGFLLSEGPSDKAQPLIDKIPVAEAAIAASDNGALVRSKGGGLMAVGRKPMGLGPWDGRNTN